MIGNVALDVVIGLVFIYLLYSLYATILMEIISSILGLRARNLCYALSRMLMDEDDLGSSGSNFLARLGTTITRFTGKSWNLKNPELYNKFFSQPSIKYLSSGGLGHRPSYLSAENFSKALIDSIKVDRVEVGELLKIQLGLRIWAITKEEEPTAGPEQLVIAGQIKKLLDQRNPDLVQFRTLLEQWYSGIPMDLEFDIALPSEQSDTIRQIESMLHDANNDLVKFKILLENWYNDTMERASGWFKQTTQAILILIGAGLAVGFDVDTIKIMKKLSKDTEAREQLVQMAIDFNARNEGLIQKMNNGKDTLRVENQLNTRLDSLSSIKQTLEADIQSARSMVVTPPSDDSSIFGYLLTILALSLGAPFWFDLLNKLVKLRTSSAAPARSGGEAGSIDSDVSNRNIINRVG
ncbi:hypothetical protein [Dyadobacter psychrophilus]|uniref:Uncharacterized protein n=1 Tax=Dyadobacter psychrophilus TaxID=651661 RepID=A0A1T5D9K4_9BACT|nr:hypothetical protein [Dyadobacter psychrophilus]SKB68349.1 hypothetical protein SAMN05660293_01454 [Dyadobacter psychrophilus]